MSSLRHGKIERAIANEIADAAKLNPVTGRPGTVLVSSWELTCEVYQDYGTLKWKPSLAQGRHTRHG